MYTHSLFRNLRYFPSWVKITFSQSSCFFYLSDNNITIQTKHTRSKWHGEKSVFSCIQSLYAHHHCFTTCDTEKSCNSPVESHERNEDENVWCSGKYTQKRQTYYVTTTLLASHNVKGVGPTCIFLLEVFCSVTCTAWHDKSAQSTFSRALGSLDSHITPSVVVTQQCCFFSLVCLCGGGWVCWWWCWCFIFYISQVSIFTYFLYWKFYREKKLQRDSLTLSHRESF